MFAPLLIADLHTIGGLPTLLDVLGCPHPSLRWRAGEVVATCMQNNESAQLVRGPCHAVTCVQLKLGWRLLHS